MRRLNKVDFPTLGRPIMAINGRGAGMNCSVGHKSSLPFCKIAHQMIRDLSCLPVVYSKTIESDSEFENQVIGSGPEFEGRTPNSRSSANFGVRPSNFGTGLPIFCFSRLFE